MDHDVECPVCLNANGGQCRQYATDRDTKAYDCDVCGRFEVSLTALLDFEAALPPIQRALLSHRIRTAETEDDRPLITHDWMKRFKTDARLPSLAMQAANLIRIIGDCVSKTGLGYAFDKTTIAIVGAFDRRSFDRLVKELSDKGRIQRAERQSTTMGEVQAYDLTLDGWERYEAERRGKIAGKYGFIAMKFGDNDLDPFVEDFVKPKIKKNIGYDLINMRDIARAGIIDNIMREQIRDAAFVLVDLTHDNSGAYWEAGYAEGLGKQVIYICEASKFEEAQTHFDTNHCTTVLWSQDPDDTERFGSELIATLRRSLNLFPA